VIAADSLEFGRESPQTFFADVPEVDGSYQLLVFAGERGKAAGNSVVLQGISMEYLEKNLPNE
jgi:hypothetical protein